MTKRVTEREVVWLGRATAETTIYDSAHDSTLSVSFIVTALLTLVAIIFSRYVAPLHRQRNKESNL